MAGMIEGSLAPAGVLRVPRSSTVDLIAVELRSAIYSGALPVGSPLGEVEIASQLGVSRSPLREAAQRLVQEGILTSTPGRGLRVSRVDKDELDDLYDARMAVESQAIRLLLDANDDALARLRQAHEVLVEASAGEDARAIGDADIDFHRTLVGCSGSRRLAHIMSTLALETRIVSFSMTEGYVVRRDVSPSYALLMSALRDGDAEGAIAALRTQFTEAIARLRGELPHSTHPEVDTVEVPAAQEPKALGRLTPGE